MSLAVNLADEQMMIGMAVETHVVHMAMGHLIGYPQDWIGNTKAIARFLWSHEYENVEL